MRLGLVATSRHVLPLRSQITRIDLASRSRSTCLARSQCRPSHSHAVSTAGHVTKSISDFQKFFEFPQQSKSFNLGEEVVVHGVLSGTNAVGAKLAFANLTVDNGPDFQFVSKWETEDSPQHKLHHQLRSLPKRSAVALTGVVAERKEAAAESTFQGFGSNFPADAVSYKIDLRNVQLLSPFPRNIAIASRNDNFAPERRHLQLRFAQGLRERLEFRSMLEREACGFLDKKRLTKVETPILFKSTPEGAREFIVPTRRRRFAYALPQSPQQYKQILMSSGLRGYYQMARCFRDEDLRADRQPEFTQLDLEMSFATGADVRDLVEGLVKDMLATVQKNCVIETALDKKDAWPIDRRQTATLPKAEFVHPYPELDLSQPFEHMTYNEVMRDYGIDKPDLRIPGKIERVEALVPQSFKNMITGIDDPIVEVIRMRPTHDSSQQSAAFVKEFFDALPPGLAENPDGKPAVMIYDSSKPMQGLSALQEFEALDELEEMMEESDDEGGFANGDILIFQARTNKPFSGGATALGTLRALLYPAAAENGLIEPLDNKDFRFLWVTGFPLFSPNDDPSEPGQRGMTGIKSTHHPFTAPLGPEDFALLETNPLQAKADHYDLVLNGVELGGGSRRIHIAEMQEIVFRDVLGMTAEGQRHFSHLLEVLKAGCPPHAGFAFGWDRLVAMLSFTESIRDVIAFPKTMKGEDPLTKSPGKITQAQLETYQLKYATPEGGK